MQRLVKAQVLNVRVSSINSTSTASLDCGNESIDEPIEYSADSPDELALVQAAARYHIKLIESSETQITVSIHDRPVTYQRLMCLPFDSNRKRMSVLLRAPDNRIVLFMKGAENVIYSRLIANSNADITLEHIDYFARLGLRTLMLGCRHLSAEEYDLFTIQLKHAYASLTNQQQVEKCHDQLESNIRMLGATAVEDRLQEDVPSTIADLKYAGISIWLLTGDKLETALAVACASRLVDDTMELLSLSRQLDERTCGHQLMEFLKQILLSKKSKSSSESTRTSYNKKLHQFLKATLSKSHALERGKTNRPLGTDLNLIQSTNGSNVIGSPDISRSNSSLSLEADDLLGQSEVARRNNAQTQQANFQKEAEKVLQHCRQTKKSSVNKFALLVDGRSLHISLRAHRELFRELAQKSMVVVCGRMSPIQKAQVLIFSFASLFIKSI